MTKKSEVNGDKHEVECKTQPMMIDDLLEMGVIERSQTPYASPFLLVKKPVNTCRVCLCEFQEAKQNHRIGSRVNDVT